jgi:hypothetical protein
MTKDEALRLALEALTDFDYDKRINAIEIIKATLETKYEPVAWEQFHEHMAGPNYVSPKSTWVGLTDEDRYEFAAATYSWEELLIAAEVKLKEKNHGNS